MINNLELYQLKLIQIDKNCVLYQLKILLTLTMKNLANNS